MNEVLSGQARAADTIEAAAFRDIVAAAPEGLARATGLRATEIGGATLLLAPGIPDTTFNRAIGLGVHRPATEADLDAAIGEFRAAGCKNFWIHLTPGALPGELPRWLEARGFTPPARRSWAKMWREAKSEPAFNTSLEVRAAGEVIRGAFGMPPPFAGWFEALSQRPRWKLFAALAGGRVVGAGFVFVDGRDAWLGAAGVAKDFRGRGAQQALMALRIREAGASGCGGIFTETGEPVGDEPNPSLQNMRRCGFQQICSRLNYAPVG